MSSQRQDQYLLCLDGVDGHGQQSRNYGTLEFQRRLELVVESQHGSSYLGQSEKFWAFSPSFLCMWVRHPREALVSTIASIG